MRSRMGAACALLFLAACHTSSNIERLPGTYVANHGHGREELILKEDGTYRHSYSAPGGNRFQNGGTWVVAKYRAGCIEIRRFRFGYNPGAEEANAGGVGDWLACPQFNLDGSVDLIYDEDRMLYFERK